MGYESSLIIKNLGSMLIIVLLTPLYMLALFAIEHLVCNGPKSSWMLKLKQSCIASRKQLYFNEMIKAFDTSYIVLVVCAFIQLKNPRVGLEFTFMENISWLLAVAVTCLCLAFPVGIFFIYKHKIKRSSPLPNLDKPLS